MPCMAPLAVAPPHCAATPCLQMGDETYKGFTTVGRAGCCSHRGANRAAACHAAVFSGHANLLCARHLQLTARFATFVGASYRTHSHFARHLPHSLISLLLPSFGPAVGLCAGRALERHCLLRLQPGPGLLELAQPAAGVVRLAAGGCSRHGVQCGRCWTMLLSRRSWVSCQG